MDFLIGGNRRPTLIDEQQGFLMLSAMAERMLSERAKGVVQSEGRLYISSFHDFYEYVAEIFPSSVAPESTGNPFPTILRGDTYTKIQVCLGPNSDLLVADKEIFRAVGGIKHRLTANGGIKTLMESSTISRANTQAWYSACLRSETGEGNTENKKTPTTDSSP